MNVTEIVYRERAHVRGAGETQWKGLGKGKRVV